MGLWGWPAGFDKLDYSRSCAHPSPIKPFAAELRLLKGHRRGRESGGVELLYGCSKSWSFVSPVFDGTKLGDGPIRPQAPGGGGEDMRLFQQQHRPASESTMGREVGKCAQWPARERKNSGGGVGVEVIEREEAATLKGILLLKTCFDRSKLRAGGGFS